MLRSTCLTIAILSVICLPHCEAQQPPQVSGYNLNWFDNFDGSSLDQGKWTPIFSTNPTNFSLHAYLPGNVAVAGGNLILISEDNPFGIFDYRSGQVISTALSRYGRFEVRANLPTSRGMWPAIWLLPDAAWPSQGEIDIMENRGNQPNITSSAFHWGTNPPFYHNFVAREQEMQRNGAPKNFHDSFHTYCAEWDPRQIRYYVDGVHYYTVRNEGVENFMTTLQTNPMRMIINTAIGGTFLPDPDASTVWPQLFEIDYVWVYDRIGQPVMNVENGNFETHGGSLSNWSLFGHTGQNISSDNNFALSGSSALKVYGQFNGGQNFSGIEQGKSVEAGDQLEIAGSVFINPADPLNNDNQVLLKVDYYSEQYAAFGTDQFISSDQVLLADAAIATGIWINRQFASTAPSGAVEARVAVVFRQVNNASGSAYVDDISIVNPGEDIVVNPTSVSVQNGKLAGGDVEELIDSDDSYIEILAGMPGQEPGQISAVVQATSPTALPSNIDFKIESSANTVGLTQIIEAINFETGLLEVVDERDTTLNDTAITITGLDSNYVNSVNSLMVFRVSYRADQPVLFFPWEIRMDQVSWTITE